MRKSNKLTVAFVKTAQKGVHSDGANLYLAVDAEGRRRWVFRYAFGGRQRDLGLGSASVIGLADARALAHDARKLLARGVDPLAEKHRRKGKKTFGAAADEIIAGLVKDRGDSKHLEHWRYTLGDKLCGSLRSLNVDEIETRHVLAVVRPIWLRTRPTASLMMSRIEHVLNAARAFGLIEGAWQNPAAFRGNLKFLLPQPAPEPPRHHAALPFEQIPDLMARLKDRRANSALALQLIILTAARAGEVLGATPDEFDLDKRIWTVPARRMKARREHRIPLSAGAVAVVQDLLLLNGSYLVPGGRSGRSARPMTSMTVAGLLKTMGVKATTHGMRSAFRDWCGECTSFPRELPEAALAHAVGNAVEQSYRRADALERRRVMMEAWSDFCLAKPSDRVVQFRGAV